MSQNINEFELKMTAYAIDITFNTKEGEGPNTVSEDAEGNTHIHLVTGKPRFSYVNGNLELNPDYLVGLGYTMKISIVNDTPGDFERQPANEGEHDDEFVWPLP